MPQEVADQDRPSWRLEHDVLALAAHVDLDVLVFRQVFVERIVKFEAAFLEESHEHDTGQRLGHREDARDAVAGHGTAGFAVGHAECAEIHLAAVFVDERRHADEFAALDISFQHGVDRRHIDESLAIVRGRRRPVAGGEDQGKDDDARNRLHGEIPLLRSFGEAYCTLLPAATRARSPAGERRSHARLPRNPRGQ